MGSFYSNLTTMNYIISATLIFVALILMFRYGFEQGSRKPKGSMFTNQQAHFIANDLTEKFKSGATIYAPNHTRVLEPLSDGSIHGGLVIDFESSQIKITSIDDRRRK